MITITPEEARSLLAFLAHLEMAAHRVESAVALPLESMLAASVAREKLRRLAARTRTEAA